MVNRASIFRACLGLAILLSSGHSFAQDWRALISPGPLGTGHEDLGGTCDKCHLVFDGIPNIKCLKCHDGIDQRIDANRGFHAKNADQKCIKCHTDHKGTKHPMVKPEAARTFDHDLTIFPLEGSHEPLECSDCHDAPLEDVRAECVGCHDNPHKPSMGDTCQPCHQSTEWDALAYARANHTTRLDGGHAEQTCIDCHADGDHLQPEVACASCHDRAHGGTEEPCEGCHSVSGFKPAKFEHDLCTCQFPGKHKEASCLSCHTDFQFTNTPTLCSGCHTAERPHDDIGECSVCHSPLSWQTSKFNHNRQSRFPLENAHLEVDCFRCHTESNGGQTLFRKVAKTCLGCHEELGEEAHGDFGNCLKCHTTEGFTSNSFNHDTTGFAIDGEHTDLNCQECHEQQVDGYSEMPSPKAPTRIRTQRPLRPSAHRNAQSKTLPASAAAAFDNRDCQHCHESPHADTASDTCTACHSSTGWRPSLFTAEQHASIGFPLKEAHAKIDCEECHVDLRLSGQPTQCSGCHMDAHQGRFGNECQTCHSQAAFAPAPGFDHQTTEFPLVGVHQKVECLECHGTSDVSDLSQKTPLDQCGTCHELGHGPELGERCEQCHNLETDPSFAAAPKTRFDHQTTLFPLERRHQVIDCQDCHPAPVDGEAPMKPNGRCETCHMDPHRGTNTDACEQCHAPDRWLMVRFDHDASGFPLIGRHAVTPCVSCHVNQQWFGLNNDCFDCHSLDAARGAQVRPDLHAFGRLNCTDCHFNRWSWRL